MIEDVPAETSGILVAMFHFQGIPQVASLAHFVKAPGRAKEDIS